MRKKVRKIIKCKCGCGEEKISPDNNGRDTKFIHGHNKAWLGKKRPDISKEKNWRWNKNISYTQLHKWIYYNLGQPKICQKCGKIELNPHKIHWANISKKYTRDFSDWMRLCISCHNFFDKKI